MKTIYLFIISLIYSTNPTSKLDEKICNELFNDSTSIFKKQLVETCKDYLKYKGHKGIFKKSVYLELTDVSFKDSSFSMHLTDRRSHEINEDNLLFYSYYFCLDTSIGNPILLACSKKNKKKLQKIWTCIDIEKKTPKKSRDILHNSKHEMFKHAIYLRHEYFYFLIEYNFINQKFKSTYVHD